MSQNVIVMIVILNKALNYDSDAWERNPQKFYTRFKPRKAKIGWDIYTLNINCLAFELTVTLTTETARDFETFAIN